MKLFIKNDGQFIKYIIQSLLRKDADFSHNYIWHGYHFGCGVQ